MMRENPPAPERVQLYAAVRELGTQELLVARVRFVDPLGDTLELDFTEETSWSLLTQLVDFHTTLRDNR